MPNRIYIETTETKTQTPTDLLADASVVYVITLKNGKTIAVSDTHQRLYECDEISVVLHANGNRPRGMGLVTTVLTVREGDERVWRSGEQPTASKVPTYIAWHFD